MFEDVKGTPVEEFMLSGYIQDNRGWFKTTDFSDIIRLVYLYRYGGLYQDLDVMPLRKIPEFLPKNFAAINRVPTDYTVSIDYF